MINFNDFKFIGIQFFFLCHVSGSAALSSSSRLKRPSEEYGYEDMRSKKPRTSGGSGDVGSRYYDRREPSGGGGSSSSLMAAPSALGGSSSGGGAYERRSGGGASSSMVVDRYAESRSVGGGGRSSGGGGGGGDAYKSRLSPPRDDRFVFRIAECVQFYYDHFLNNRLTAFLKFHTHC